MRIVLVRAVQGKGGDEVRFIAAENIRKPIGKQGSGIFEVDFVPIEAGRAEGKRIAQEAMEFFHGLDQQVIGGHPYWAAPVGVASEQRRVGFPRNIPYKRVPDAGNVPEFWRRKAAMVSES